MQQTNHKRFKNRSDHKVSIHHITKNIIEITSNRSRYCEAAHENFLLKHKGERMSSIYCYGPIVQRNYPLMVMVAARLMKMAPEINSPSDRTPEQASKLDLRGTGTCGDGKIRVKLVWSILEYLQFIEPRGRQRDARSLPW
jgi:hypothetical protein